MKDFNISTKDIQLAIVRTIVFFDLFSHPLTPNEIRQYLNKKVSREKVFELLNEGIEGLNKEKGFYFLEGRKDIVETRMKKYNYTDKKIKIALRVSGFFKFIPWIKMIAIGNSIGHHNLKRSGDIDFFIITRKNRIWLTRLLCAGSMKLLNLRPTKKNKKNKICLSFYISDDNMNLKNLRIEDDIYFDHWLASLIPIFNPYKTYEKFIEENSWIRKIFPNWNKQETFFKRSISKKNRKERKNHWTINILEKISKIIQHRIMSKDIKETMNKGNGVVVNDKILKLYIHDNRKAYRDKFKDLIKKYGMDK